MLGSSIAKRRSVLGGSLGYMTAVWPDARRTQVNPLFSPAARWEWLERIFGWIHGLLFDGILRAIRESLPSNPDLSCLNFKMCAVRVRTGVLMK